MKPIGILMTDTHLGESTIEVNISVFRQAIDHCKRNGLGVLLHGGDIFTSRKGQPEIVLNAFKFILDMLEAEGIVLYVIPGNHDKVSYVGEASYLDAFTSHKALMVASPIGRMDLERNIMVHFLPYYDEELAYRKYLDMVLEDVRGGYHHILITHVGLDGILNNKGVKVDNELRGDIFDRFDLLLIGHYHNTHPVSDKIFYVGSTHQANFGEDEDKGLTIIYDDITCARILLDTPKYRTIQILPSDLDTAITKQIIDASKEGKIRVQVAGDPDSVASINMAKLDAVGVKVEVIRDSYKPMDIEQAKHVQATSLDIELAYGEWFMDRGHDMALYDYGLAIIKQNM
jgi:exonuclease SbcD